MHPEILAQIIISFGLLGWFKSICDTIIKKSETSIFDEKGTEC